MPKKEKTTPEFNQISEFRTRENTSIHCAKSRNLIPSRLKLGVTSESTFRGLGPTAGALRSEMKETMIFQRTSKNP